MTLEFKRFQNRTVDAVRILTFDQAQEAMAKLLGCDVESAKSYYTITIHPDRTGGFLYAQRDRDEEPMLRCGDMLVKSAERGYDYGGYKVVPFHEMVVDWEPVDPEHDWPGFKRETPSEYAS